ncbi:MAG: 7-carboxy-7-deazaguanine synthase QueE [bacterium]
MKVNEIFYSLQGEGYFSGTAAVFVRLSGCNLHCPFCDTQHESGREMTDAEIVAEVAKFPARNVVVTGGEPSLQLTRSFVNAIHDIDKMVAVETNGTHRLPGNVDWITFSPKDAFFGNTAKPVLNFVDEIKVVFDGEHEPSMYPDIMCTHARYLQPCDTGDPVRNAEITTKAIEYIKKDPRWKLSLQIHKILNIR